MKNDRLARRIRRLKLSWQTSLGYFPWRTASRTFLLQALGFVTGLVATGYTLRYEAIHSLMYAAPPGSERETAISAFDARLALLFAIFVILGFLWHAFVTYTGLRPMGRILRKLRPRHQGTQGEESSDLYLDEPGEWQDLEKRVSRLSRGIRQHEENLSQEREELVTILGSVNDAIVAMGPDTEPLYFNSRFAVLFGAGTTGGGALPLRERFREPEILDGFERVLGEGKTRTFRVRLRTELHDSEREFAVAVSPLMKRDVKSSVGAGAAATDLQIYGAVAIFHDISELKATEQIRIDFVANASHELKTPLTSIKGYVDTIRDDISAGRNEDAAKFLNVVSRNVDRLMLLVNDLLDISVLESGAEVRKTMVSTAEVSELAIRLTESRRTKRHTIRLETHAERVLGDPRRIEQILVNLIDNATKYTPEGAEIRIIWEPGAGANQGDVILRIRDSGRGIPDEHLPRLFERFYRVDQGRAREVGGTGLGLAIVKHIVLAHGGSIAVKSRLGEGSEFICRFPSR